MATSFKNGVSLHQLLETAPLGALQDFLLAVDEASYAEAFGPAPWSEGTDEADIHALRRQLLDIANALDPPAAAPLDRHAHRMLTLAEGRGSETIRKVGTRIFSHTDADAFAAQLDDLGRSLWLYQHHSLLFDEAESLFYADHYRNYGRLYDAFELAAGSEVTLTWDEPVADALARDIQQALELSGRCTVTHVDIPATPSGNADSVGTQHLVIVRHGGPLSSVAEFLETEGTRLERYYRPLNEATLLFTPDAGVIEVFSASPSVRQAVAASFAATALKIDLSTRPLTLKHYNLSRFLTSLQLPLPRIEGFDIERVAVVDVDARPDNFKHRLSLRVTIDDDIEEVAGAFFSQRGIDPEALVDGGFIERCGRLNSLLLDEDGLRHEVTLRAIGKPGCVAYDHPVDGRRVELQASDVDRYRIRHDWLDEIVHKGLKAQLTQASLTKLDECLIAIGEITLGAERVPCYLARDLRTPKTLQRLDTLLRARSDQGVGLVLSAGRDHPLCLGPNVIAPIADYLAADNATSGDGQALLELDRLASHFSQGKVLARGGMVVDLVKHNDASASLYIPGKPALTLVGEKQIAMFDILVRAYKQGSPIVKTKELMLGSESFSPSSAFRKERWDSINGVYLGLPPGVKRGAWMLLV